MQKLFSIINIVALVLQLVAPVFADEATPSADTTVTPTATESSITPAPQAAPAATAAGSAIIILLQTATPEATLATPSAETPPPVIPESTPSESSTSTPEIAGQSTPEAQLKTQTQNETKHGDLSTTILRNTSVLSLDLSSPTSVDSATVTTNKPDYSPIETVIITGTNFIPNQEYTLYVSSTDPPAVSFSTPVTTNPSGSFTYAYQLDGTYRPNYAVEAKDRSDLVVASTTFTDSATANSATVNGGSSVTVGPGDTITAAVNATAGSANSDKWKGTGWRIATTPPGSSVTCFNNSDHTSTTVTETFSITAPTTAGTYNAYFQTFSDNGCSNDPSALVTLTNGVTVQSRDLTAVKSNNLGGGNAVVNSSFNWIIRVSNAGAATATFSNNDELLKDEMSNSGVNDYGTPSVVTSGTTGTINCTQSGGNKENLSCKASGTVTMPASSFFDVTVAANPTATGTLTNPKNTKTCAADPGDKVVESDETNNNCSDSVTVAAADTTAPTVVSVDSDGQTYNSSTVSPSTIKVTFSENIANIPTISVSGSGQTVTNCGDADAKTFCFDYTIPVAIDSTTKTIAISGAQDSSTNTMTTDSSHIFTVDTKAPTSSITSATDGNSNIVNASGLTKSNSISIAFSVSDSGGIASSECKIDGGSYSTCTSPKSYSSLSDGSHTVNVKSTDNAGNVESTAIFTWTVDATAPVLFSKTTYSGWYNANQTSTFTYTDATSGIVSGTPVSCDITTEGTAQTCSVTPNVCDAAGNCNTTLVTSNGADIDKTNPAIPTATPVAGDYTSDQSVTLASSDSGSDLAAIYYTIDGSTPDNSKTLYSGAITVDKDMTIKAIAYDNAGNASSILSAAYGIPPKISAEASSSVTSSSTTITWTTDDLSTSRVVYDSVSHAVLGAAPNYGYANSTIETDTSPKVTSHSVGISELSAGTTYYYRTISHGSPEAVSSEQSFSTSAVAGASTSSASGGGGGGPFAAPSCNDTKPGSAPTLTSAVAGTNTVTLFWSPAASPVTYYLVTYGSTPGAQTYGNPNVGGSGATSYTVSGLSGGTTYYFKIRAGDGCAPGDYSNELSANPAGGFVSGPATGFAPGVLGATENVETGLSTESGVLGTGSAEVREVSPSAGNAPWWQNGWLVLLIITLGGAAGFFFWRHWQAD